MHTIVAGTGISGLLISDRLSKAGHPHVLVGGPRPDPDVPRLGESISLHGTIGLREVYPDASRFFTSKKSLRIVLREQQVLFDFDFSTSFARGVWFRLASTAPPARSLVD